MPRVKMEPTALCLLAAAYTGLFLNLGFADRLLGISARQTPLDPRFLITVPFVLVALLNLSFLPFSFRRIVKPALVFILLTSSLLNYASLHYGIVFDHAMFLNIVETDAGEAASYLNMSLLGAFLFSGLLPVLALHFVEVREQTWKRAAFTRGASVLVSVGIVLLVASFHFQEYVTVGRNNKILQKLVVPVSPYVSAYKFAHKEYFSTQLPYRTLADDAKNARAAGARKKLVLLILGETQRSMNYSLYGYERETDAALKERNVVAFRNVSSYGTATATSVPFIFSVTPESYDDGRESTQDGLTDVLRRAGVDVYWKDNDGGCKNACQQDVYEDMRVKYAARKEYCRGTDGCYDGLFVEELKNFLASTPKKDTLLVFHIMGSHGPTYWQRYPADKRRFQPDCPKDDINNCTQEELVNTYDNTISYANDVMAQLIDVLNREKGWDTSMLFLSDHGESLGEKGLYLHGMPRAFAPAEQTSVPMIAWISGGFAAQSGLDRGCLGQRADTMKIDNANLSDSLLGLLDISTDIYTREADYFSACRTPVRRHAAVPADREKKT